MQYEGSDILTETEMRRVLKLKCDESSPADVARQAKVSRAYMSDVLSGKRHVSERIAKFLGFDTQVETMRIYKRKQQ